MDLNNKAVSTSLITLATISVFYVLVVGKAFLVPLAVAVMIWYVINALSRNFVRVVPWVTKPNWLTKTLSILSIGLFIALTVDMIQTNVADVRAAIPDYSENFAKLLDKIEHMVSPAILELIPNPKDLLTKLDFAHIASGLTGTLKAMIEDISLVLIYVPFLLAEQGTFKRKISEIFPEQRKHDSVMSILTHTQEDIEKYLWIKTLTSALTGLVSYFVLRLVGVDFAVFWAFTIFMLNYIPTVGSIIGTLFPALLVLIQFDTFGPFFIVLFGVGAIQVLVGNVLEPKLMGNSLNISPLMVMLSLTLWGSIWGIAGALLSVPITVMLLIIFAHFEPTRYIAILLSGDGSLKFAQHSENKITKNKNDLDKNDLDKNDLDKNETS